MRGREIKKGKVGQSAQYVTRSAALKLLQVTLKDFRRLCILKGIYPRDPKKKLKGKDKTYYHKKDIKFLSHEPLLDKFREFKTFLKKYTKARGRKEWSRAKKLQQAKPDFPLDHLVRERYPTFVDAIRDLDDPLTMAHLFAGLQQKITKQHYTEHAENALRLTSEFQNYVLRAHALRKVFVSIKGIYYQCSIMGQPVTWVVPHKFSQQLPTDVDYRVMLTFLDFYITLLKFVNFKLYYDLGLKYPPAFDKSKQALGEALQAIETLPLNAAAAAATKSKAAPSSRSDSAASGAQQRVVDSLVGTMEEEEDDDEEDEEKATRDAMDEFTALSREQGQGDSDQSASVLHMDGEDDEARTVRQLFGGLTFFLSRETAQESLEFVLLSGGATVHMDSVETRQAITNQTLKVTHWVLDRPSVFNAVEDVEYVQPQWVYDSFNSRALLPIRFYAPGAPLPPHLSPFVDDEKEGYIPRQRKMLEEWGVSGGASKTSKHKGPSFDEAAAAAGDVEDEESDDDEEEETEAYQQGLAKESAGISYSEHKEQDKKGKAKSKGKAMEEDDEDSSEEEDDEEDDEEEDDEEDEDEEDEEEEQKKTKQSAGKRKRREEEEQAREMAKIMMDKKSARLYQRMQTGIAKKQAAVDTLKAKRRKLEKEQKAAAAAAAAAPAKKGAGASKKKKTRKA